VSHPLFFSRYAWRTEKKKKEIPNHFLSKQGKNPRWQKMVRNFKNAKALVRQAFRQDSKFSTFSLLFPYVSRTFPLLFP